MCSVLMFENCSNSKIDDFECRWSINHRSTWKYPQGNWQSVDIMARHLNRSNVDASQSKVAVSDHILYESVRMRGQRMTTTVESQPTAAFNFLLELLSTALNLPTGQVKAAKLIVPRTSGHIIRSDIIPLRMVDCRNVSSVISFSKPQQWFPANLSSNGIDKCLEDLFTAVAAGILIDAPSSLVDMSCELDALEVELRNRLSFPWLLREKKPTQTLAMVRGALRSPEHGGTGSNIYSAAKALGVNIIVLDSVGHWLQRPEYADLCAAFLPIDTNRDPELPARILDALNRYNRRIDGIVTYLESYAPFVARVAECLSLPTASVEAFEVAMNKYRTSIAEGHNAYEATSAGEALSFIHKADMRYPLVVKPYQGWSSEGVYKVDDDCALEKAVDSIDRDRHGETFVVEEYCNGPEVDANLVLCNGKLLFSEVSDDFPKIGDGNQEGSAPSFIELANVLPSQLPSSELNLLRDSLHKSLLRLGFSSGFFHLEARLKNSDMEYMRSNGVLELDYRLDSEPSKAPIESWLIEINPRPPGIQASDAVEGTYGVDYVGLGLLFPLNDLDRARALSQPFFNGPQYWCEVVFIPVERGGIFDADDVCDELKHRRPDLARQIPKSFCFFKRGESVPSPASGHNAWIAYFNVFSRNGRQEVLEIAETIRRELRYRIV
ncbi:MAG: hypothetical protein LQ340_001275 [Diploschistes diacapsis]|nr:MAG: hypothetical protein LQ340_001275 [Diploschistes diacapsis]